ncbi:cysteine--tRNA ligase [Spirochaetia bacterium 38H-sp]|uniref:Cysteine--tRNA ligase n=1 Tax=Rarispira pelagica TaxID=3141764 RepID=A0ABU9UCR6_9SPIR
MDIRLFNSMGRKVEDFSPMQKDTVGMYACGPTVYNYAHIGNLRTYIFEDLLRRTLEYAGYKVKHVMNVTDVGHLTSDGDEGEDKMIKSAREKGMSVWDIAHFFSDAFFNDIKELNILMPTVVCRATEHIPEMIDLVKRLEKNGHTYVSEGNVYYDTATFPDYGKLALLDRQELKAGARVAVDKSKKNPRDFVLWFTRSKFENQAMVWDSPWGRGYPGWHLECSAMSMKYLGEQFDIHCGGIDHIPVHHTNEIAQSEGATGKTPWVRYWLHGEFLVLDSGKMSKSSGNFLTLSVLTEKGFSPLDYRYYCLGAHYRSQLVFSFSALESAKNARRSLIEKISSLKPDDNWADKDMSDKALSYRDQFVDYISNDLNSPRAIAVLWSVIKDSFLSDTDKALLVSDMDRVLGLSLVKEIGAKEAVAKISDEDMELIRQREIFRKEKNYSEADRIRNLLAEKGIIIKDTPQGTVWEVSKDW